MKGLKMCFAVYLIIGIPWTTKGVQQKSYPIQTEVKDGIKTIINPGYPKDGRFTAKLTLEISCGDESGRQAGILKNPNRLDVDDEGNVAVTDNGDTNIKIYDSGGRYLRTIGRRGQGPGEFGGMLSASFMKGGKIIVLDATQQRTALFSVGGAYLSGSPLDGFYKALAVDGHGRVFLSKWEAVKTPDNLSTEYQEIPYMTKVYRANAVGTAFVHVVDFPGESMFIKSAGGGAGGIGAINPFSIVWTINREGNCFGGYNGDFNIGVFGPEGKKRLAFGRPYTPVKNSRYQGMPGQKKTMPPYRTIILEENGNLWIELYQEDAAEGYLYDVFSPDGVYLKQVATEQRIGLFKNGKVYGIVRPEDGSPLIKRYKMELVSNGK